MSVTHTQEERKLLAIHKYKSQQTPTGQLIWTRKLSQGFLIQLQKQTDRTLWRADIFKEYWTNTIEPERKWEHIHSLPVFAMPYRLLDYIIKQVYIYFEMKFNLTKEELQDVPPITENTAPNLAATDAPKLSTS